MKKNSFIIFGAFLVVIAILSVLGMVMPEQVVLRVPLWLIGSAVFGVLVDRFFSKRL
jgi:lipoprotein signal peptidase